MNLRYFLEECNISPFFKKYRPITQKFLKDNGFIKKDYDTPRDLLELKEKLFFIPPVMIENTDPYYTRHKRTHKDLYHAELIKLHDNKKFIKKLRQELKMPYDHRGFRVFKKILPEIGSYTGWNFEFIEPDYKKWFFIWCDGYKFPKGSEELDKLMAISPLVRDKIFKVVAKALKKWYLPWRYFEAVQELILFNNIIPAHSGISWFQDFGDERVNRMPKFSIGFEIDTTKEELITAIREDECSILKNRHKYLMGKVRKKLRKPKEKEKLIEIYNKHKKDGMKDKDIFAIIHNNPKFEHLRPSAIRDRIKRK